ncbi:sodium-dependent glucose transporter 1 [Caerostris darwini]|uniref:Sodium-dependent glucose transporter 1 n=1 Tax=Caerostris darwini TaxID=1538125 RepID=A0AAV4PBV2_9ARAC|nr:sodium-dependent glucose transporter 1 [Caerostris darwini]
MHIISGSSSGVEKKEETKCDANSKQTVRKVTLSFLIGLSYLCLGIYKTIPGPTLLYLKMNVNENLITMPSIFISRSFGYVVGYLSGGVIFDAIQSSTVRHFFIIIIQMVTAVTAVAIPFCGHIVALSATFFAAGLCLSVLDVGFNTYLLYLWKGECYMYYQIFRFIYGAGGIIAPVLARIFIADIEAAENSNSTDSPGKVMTFEQLPRLMYAYIFLACMIAFVTFLWMVIVFCPSCKNERGKIGLHRRIPTKPFFLFAFITTALLCFIVGCVDSGYQHILATYAFTAYGFSTLESVDLTFTFWMCYTFGALVAVFLSYMFHPFSMILCNLLMEVVAAIILIFLSEASNVYMFLGHGILGLGASSLFALTILWFHTYLKVTHKIMAILLLSEAIAEMIIPKVLGFVLQYDFHGISYFLLAVPVGYFIVLAIQCMWFFPFGEQYMVEYPDKSRSRIRVCPIFFYHPVIKSSESQINFGKDSRNIIFEPRSRDSSVEVEEKRIQIQPELVEIATQTDDKHFKDAETSCSSLELQDVNLDSSSTEEAMTQTDNKTLKDRGTSYSSIKMNQINFGKDSRNIIFEPRTRDSSVGVDQMMLKIQPQMVEIATQTDYKLYKDAETSCSSLELQEMSLVRRSTEESMSQTDDKTLKDSETSYTSIELSEKDAQDTSIEDETGYLVSETCKDQDNEKGKKETSEDQKIHDAENSNAEISEVPNVKKAKEVGNEKYNDADIKNTDIDESPKK